LGPLKQKIRMLVRDYIIHTSGALALSHVVRREWVRFPPGKNLL